MAKPPLPHTDLSIQHLEDSAFHAYREWHVYLVLRQATLQAQQVNVSSLKANTPSPSLDGLATTSVRLSQRGKGKA